MPPQVHHLSGRRAGASDLLTEAVLLGRDRRVCAVWVDEAEEGVSRRHAQIWQAEGAWWIRDLGAPNGTTVDGRRLSAPVALRSGAVIGLGPTVTLRFDALGLDLPLGPPPPPPPVDPVRLLPRLTLILMLFSLVVVASLWGAKQLEVDRAEHEARRQQARAELWARLEAGEDLADLEALIEAATAASESRAGPAPLDGDPLSMHIHQAMEALIGQPPDQAVDPFFRAAVEHQIAGIYTNPRCSCRLSALRGDLLALLRTELRAAGGVESRADILIYIAWIESCYNPRACSPAAARGMWQFIPKTARRYELSVDETVDERCDWRKSTRAAARYFTDTFRACGDAYPLLAIAAYNTGEQRACAIAHDEDIPADRRDVLGFIAHGYLLPETVSYVPRLIAASFVGEHPEEAARVAHALNPNIQTDTQCQESWMTIPISENCSMGMQACPTKTGVGSSKSSEIDLWAPAEE